MGIYATPTELRTELGVSSGTLSDGAANKLIADAEDIIDAMLGPWPVQDNGRRIVEADVHDWQWAKLKRATVLLAARFYSKPALLAAIEYDEVRGPEFHTKGPKTKTITAPISRALELSGLRILGARAIS